MSQLQTHKSPVGVKTSTSTSSESRRLKGKKLDVQQWNCLVLSLDRGRQERLAATVQGIGWRPLLASSPTEAIQLEQRVCSQLALVDLAPDGDGRREGLFRFVEHLAGRAEPLVMVCDDHPAPEAEVWARKLGVWLYLPEPEIGEDLASLCGEALRIAQAASAEARA